MPQATEKTPVTLEDLIELMRILRSEQGCPWDRKQNLDSIKGYLIEETYEVLEAVDERDPVKIREELGDVLFQIVFYAQLLQEAHQITMADIIETIHTKMIRRHPHVFGQTTVKNAEEVLVNWELIKQTEKKAERTSLLDGVPKELPSLLRAHRIQAKASHVGFEWDNFQQVLEKLDEEFAELRHAYKHGQIDEIEDEFGDVLFVLVSIARFLKVNPDDALRKAITKFTTRFASMERQMATMQKTWKDLSSQQMDQLWQNAKME